MSALQFGAQFHMWACEWDVAEGIRCSKVVVLEPVEAGDFVFEAVGAAA
jgi:hypothetical protein